ncbi:Alkyltransferase-like protein 1 [Tilletia horrida]|nr:Alkyltransferase-like protein 1 [Tilletia horrida]
MTAQEGGSVDAAWFHARTYELVRLIPVGKVTTYGHIAKVSPNAVPSRPLGLRSRPFRLIDGSSLAILGVHSRMVGSALKWLADDSVPWQRVVGAGGIISERGDGGQGAHRQAQALQAEGVEVTEAVGAGIGTGGRWRVSMTTYGWFPTAAPDDAGEA